ncbi:MAG: ankyrin repeat domain-containing protein, partial [Calditrichota bacterium]
MRISIVISFILFGFSLAFAGEKDEAFLEAVRAENIAKVKVLLAEGADINATGRYEVTALSYAADRGNVELVNFLLDKGADMTRKDTFYGASAIDWAAYNKHAAVVKILLDRGADGAEGVLVTGVQEKDFDLFNVALESGKISPEGLTRALAVAKRNENKEMMAALEKAGAKPAEKPEGKKVATSILESYVGQYVNNDIGMQLTFSLENGSLKGVVAGQPALTYAPEDETTFKAVEFEGITVRFQRSGKMAESFELEQGNSKFTFKRVQPEAEEVAEAAKESVTKATVRVKGEVVAANWPSFRGQGATGVADKQFPPVEWDAESGKNITWKTPIPGLSHASPVVWDNKIFLTTAVSSDTSSELRVGLYGDVAPDKDVSEHSWRVYCINKNNGAIVWEREAYRGVPQVMRHTKATQANSTPATDGQYVVALFGAEGLFCYNMDGELLWKQDLGFLDSGWFYDPDYQWGHGSSPIIYNDMVIVQCDRQKDSYIAAYSLKDGKQRWKTMREEIPSWATPTVYSEGETAELLTNGTHGIRGYNPETG